MDPSMIKKIQDKKRQKEEAHEPTVRLPHGPPPTRHPPKPIEEAPQKTPVVEITLV